MEKYLVFVIALPLNLRFSGLGGVSRCIAYCSPGFFSCTVNIHFVSVVSQRIFVFLYEILSIE